MRGQIKLLGFMAATAAMMFIPNLNTLAIVAVVVAAVIAAMRVPPRALFMQLRVLTVVIAVAFLVNALFLGWAQAALLSGRIWLAVLVATVFTLTTAASDVLDAVVRTIRPIVGEARAERAALAVQLTLRSIPQLNTIVGEVLDARKARGLERSIRAIFVPTLLRALTSANELGDALHARGYGEAISPAALDSDVPRTRAQTQR